MPLKIAQWFLTYPQCEGTPNDLLVKLEGIDKVVHYLIAQEQHKDGNNHLHAYVKFVDGVYLKAAPKTFDFDKFHGNYQPVRSCKSVIKYCSKDENYISNFDLKSYQAKKGKLSVDVIKSKSTAQALTDGDISFMQVRAYQQARSVLEEPYHHHSTRGIWIHGVSGVGKSRIVREHCSVTGMRLFSKAQNKWFDGYDGEEVIMIDDFDQRGECLDHLLKIWTDRYACTGEIKGSTVQLRHKEFIVTSNFSIEELFKDVASVTLDAIKRRFRVVYMDKYSNFDPRVILKKEDKVVVMGPEPPLPCRRSRSPIDRMTFTEEQVYGTNLRLKNKKY